MNEPGRRGRPGSVSHTTTGSDYFSAFSASHSSARAKAASRSKSLISSTTSVLSIREQVHKPVQEAEDVLTPERELDLVAVPERVCGPMVDALGLEKLPLLFDLPRWHQRYDSDRAHSWLRDQRAIFALLAERGFGDIRPVHDPVFTSVSGEGSRITELAEKANLTKQSLQYAVDDLERLGYAERIADPEDRRAKLVRLTPRGREAVLVAREAIAAEEERWRQLLGKREMAELRRLLERLCEQLRHW